MGDLRRVKKKKKVKKKNKKKGANLTKVKKKDQTGVILVLEKASLEVAKVRKTYQLLKSDDHANFLRKNGRDPAHYRPDITHQAILMILDSSVNKAGRTYKHFAEFMLELLQKLNISAAGRREKLMEVIKNHVKDLTAVEYVEDIYCFYKYVESEWRPSDYMRSQPEINKKMRIILVEWLVVVYVKFELNPEMFDFTVNIMDRLVSAEPVPRKELQLVGISALLISSKYEEIWPPHGEDLVDIADHAYSHKQLLVMEKTILSTLKWHSTVPRHYVFLARLIEAFIADQQMENMIHYLAELVARFIRYI
ncbi:hypothetical protein Bca52824_056054 [Brassica carinata]|uniref:Cyclin-like domain-containing protein n=1 Tax=Brassica carinata TaxID=52824 RepID=A0A8X7QN59_BRACI|nr:hypothetical protein Bca52824_056054 [Brassica carinata]